jgi:hypothetical protein
VRYFNGVGYILVNELLVGFKPAPKQKLKNPLNKRINGSKRRFNQPTTL